jgi:hypothetical protein
VQSGLIPTGDARCYLPFETEVCPDNGERPCTCINPKQHQQSDPGGTHGCHCGRRWDDAGVQVHPPGWGQAPR